MTHPVRIQLKRTKGWRMPENTIKVDRSTKWGNPFIVNVHVKPGSKSGAEYYCVHTIDDALDCYRLMLEQIARDKGYEIFQELRGKNLACWCSLDQPCHADVLLDLANE